MDDDTVELHASDEFIQVKNSRKKRFLKIAFVGCIFLMICVVLMGGSFGLGYLTGEKISERQDDYVLYDHDEIYPDRSDPKQENILNSREFQITLKNSDYQDRMTTITAMVEQLRELSGEDITLDDFEAEVYVERQYDCKVCGHQYSELRRRIHYNTDGTVKEDETNVDINEDITVKKDGLNWDLSPSEEYAKDCEQKLEEG